MHTSLGMSVAAGAFRFGGGIEVGTGDGHGACAAADDGESQQAASAIATKEPAGKRRTFLMSSPAVQLSANKNGIVQYYSI
jgi:hypothetical protein